MKTASIYQRNSGYVIHPNHRLSTGVYMAGLPVWHLPPECADAELGATIRKALGGARSGLPHPVDWNEALKPFLDSCGVRSWARLAQKAKLIQVEARDHSVQLTPTKNGGNRGPEKGFTELPELGETVNEDAEDGILGRAARNVLDRCS